MADARTRWCAYVHARVGDEDEPNASREEKKGCVVAHVCMYRRESVCVCVCVCVSVGTRTAGTRVRGW